MTHVNDATVIRNLLTSPGRWAVVGLSKNKARAAWNVSALLQQLGHTIVPVHPSADEVHGQRGYPSLGAIGAPIDVVDVFVHSQAAGDIVDQAIAIGAKAVWLQLDVIDEDAAARAKAAGLDVVMDTCPSIERRSLGLF
ncbi:CoA-binding protein [Saxibacter everestensis]|uniref:CoA-binding protein n=1 Tax=Saxibacter everestensis TaxID=2909229 RepID=A0ABY8QP50_9MICO|nr:CoA-binding protein [Brevibacteriaceae bacterium ZFBP1038]